VLSFVVICRFWLAHHDMFRTPADVRRAAGLAQRPVAPVDRRAAVRHRADRPTGRRSGGRDRRLRRPGAPSPRLAPSIANLSVFALVFLLALIIPGQALWGLLLLAPAGLLADRLHPATPAP
jgi:hypothetical protein